MHYLRTFASCKAVHFMGKRRFELKVCRRVFPIGSLGIGTAFLRFWRERFVLGIARGRTGAPLHRRHTHCDEIIGGHTRFRLRPPAYDRAANLQDRERSPGNSRRRSAPSTPELLRLALPEPAVPCW